MKAESKVNVVKESVFSSFSARKYQTTSRDYRPTFCEGKCYQFVPKPTLQHYKKMEESKDICYIALSFTVDLYP